MDCQSSDSIRETVIRTFRGYGASDAEIAGMTDTLLIRDGHYRGRSFRTSRLMAVLMGTLMQFYDSDGEMLGTLAMVSEPRHQKAA